MRIDTFEQLKAWNLRWPAQEPGPWELSFAGIQQALGNRTSAIGVYWIGYSQGTHGSFKEKYCGKAVRQPLFARLLQHVTHSHNPDIRDHLNPKNGNPKIWFRFVEFAAGPLASHVEGTMIIGFREEYVWNRRNEWAQHWALEH